MGMTVTSGRKLQEEGPAGSMNQNETHRLVP